MSEEKFTRGPWAAYSKTDWYEIIDLDFNNLLDKVEIGEESANSNAQLMASAPSLLAENKKLRQEGEQSLLLYNSMVKTIEKYQSVMEKIRTELESDDSPMQSLSKITSIVELFKTA